MRQSASRTQVRSSPRSSSPSGPAWPRSDRRSRRACRRRSPTRSASAASTSATRWPARPIRLKMIGAGLHSSTTMKYAMEACRGRFPCISCGFGEARRVVGHQAALDARRGIRPGAFARRRARCRCTTRSAVEVTWLGIDITRRFVAPVVEGAARGHGADHRPQHARADQHQAARGTDLDGAADAGGARAAHVARARAERGRAHADQRQGLDGDEHARCCAHRRG